MPMSFCGRHRGQIGDLASVLVGPILQASAMALQERSAIEMTAQKGLARSHLSLLSASSRNGPASLT